ncbi:MAG: hypothetical protein AAB407_02795 [Patescibacteria group bacterium]
MRSAPDDTGFSGGHHRLRHETVVLTERVLGFFRDLHFEDALFARLFHSVVLRAAGPVVGSDEDGTTFGDGNQPVVSDGVGALISHAEFSPERHALQDEMACVHEPRFFQTSDHVTGHEARELSLVK